MIFGFVKGQQFSISQPIVVANSNDYLEMKFIFQTADWNGLSIWAHFTQDEKTVFEINVKDNVISKSDRLNLSEGKWKVYLHGNDPDGTMRITTEVKELTVKKAGFICAPMPEIPLSAAEQIDQKAQRAENIANQALTEVKKVAPLEEEARKSMVQAQTSASEAKLSETNAKASEIAAGEFADTAKIAAEQATIAAQASESNAAKTDSDRQIAEQSVLQNTDIAKAINADVVKNDALCKQVEADTAQVAADKATVISAKDAAVQAAQSAESSKTSAGKSAIDAKASADTAGLKLQQTTQAMQNINALTERAESAESIATTKANEALASANLAKQSETMATNSAGEAVESARQALESQKAAALSEAESLKQANLAKESQIAAQTSQTSALQNANEAKESAAKALESANGANGAATTAAEQADKATAEAGKATTAATQAEGFAQRAEAGATATEQAIPEVKKYVADNFANAFKNQVSGEVIAVDDVSPMQNEIRCRVERANLIPYPYWFGAESNRSGMTVISNSDGSISLNGTAEKTTTFILIRGFEVKGLGLNYKDDYCIQLFGAPERQEGIYLQVNGIKANGDQFYITAATPTSRMFKISKDAVEVQIFLGVLEGTDCTGITVKPQIKRGGASGHYDSYIPDLSKVKVSRAGKNLFDVEKASKNEGWDNAMPWNAIKIPAVKGVPMTVSYEGALSEGLGFYAGVFKTPGSSSQNLYGWIYHNSASSAINNEIHFVPEDDFVYLNAYPMSGSVGKERKAFIDNIGKTLQFEIGSKKTEYEPYQKADFTPDTDGIVQGMTSLSPNMTILSDTPGAIINAEYNQDSNAVIKKLSNRIAELESKATNI